MIKCEFCTEEFEFGDEYQAHLQFKHYEEYQTKKMFAGIAPYMQQITQLARQPQTRKLSFGAEWVSVKLAELALQYSKSPEEIAHFYGEVLAWFEGRVTKLVPVDGRVTKAVPAGTSLIDIAEVRSFVSDKGVTEEEVEAYKKVGKVIGEWINQDLARKLKEE